jgi:glycosyltransferase involved in cell wall biosynthesis
MPITLGVLITYHNERELLQECLESLLSQPRRPNEILVYDDRSDYPAEDYVRYDIPVRIICGKVNKGPSYGRNVLLHASQSDYIHFHDADDLFHPDWCQRVRQTIRETQADAIFTEISSFIGKDLSCEKVLGLKQLIDEKDLVRFCIHASMLTPAGTYLREAVLRIGGYRNDLWQSEDYDFHIRLASSGITYSVIEDPLIFIRVRWSGRSHNHFEVWNSALHSISRLANELPTEYLIDLSEAAARIGSMLFQLGALPEARNAFQLARELGPPNFEGRAFVYRILARKMGQERAELVARWYRKKLPTPLRVWLSHFL